MALSRWLILTLTTLTLLWTARAQDAAITFTVIDRPTRTPESRPIEAGRWSLGRADSELRAPLDSALAEADLLATGYRLVTLYGRSALAVTAIDASGGGTAYGVAGLLPDDRVLVALSPLTPTPAPDALDRFLDAVIYSYPDLPTTRGHQQIWTVDIPGAADWIGVALEDEWAYGLHPRDGIAVIAGSDGALNAVIPFDAPAQATAIAVRDGIIYIGDRACRCVRRVGRSDGRWLDPIGRFAGGAPHAIAIDGDQLIAIDGDSTAYTRRAYTLNADGSVREGARVAAGSGDAPSLALDPAAIVHSEPPPAAEAVLQAAQHRARIITLGADGRVRMLDDSLPPARIGDRDLTAGMVTLGTVSGDRPVQTWTLARGAGMTCLYAVDPARRDPFELGLDMAIRVIAADGTEIAYNDDHAGEGPYGVYDAALCADLTHDEPITVQIEYVAGSGAYMLAVVPERALNGSGEGVIAEASPVQRWTFDGNVGDTITVTMTALDGDLDPALALIGPEGGLIASNDDALDSTLGVNAQIVQVVLPAAGRYTVEAGRWSGSGVYALALVNTAP